ncbi:MAG: hypothetical protein KC550_02590 [Nanoarchaeota archaeon]|nr:hypothetical protein [Nanoarchaeota archaeon]
MAKKYLIFLLLLFNLSFVFGGIGTLDDDDFEGFPEGTENVSHEGEGVIYDGSQSCTYNYAELKEQLVELQKNYLDLSKKYESLLDKNIETVNETETDDNYNEDLDLLYCITKYDPVCGVDGKNYGNSCTISKAGIEVDYEGFCKEVERISCKDSYGEAYWCDSMEILKAECGDKLRYNQVGGVCDENGNSFCGACIHDENYTLFMKPEIIFDTSYVKIEYAYGIENYYDYSASIKDLKVSTVFRYWDSEDVSKEWKILTNGVIELGNNYKYPVEDGHKYNYEISDYYGNKIYSGNFVNKVSEIMKNYTVRCYFLNRDGETIDSCYYNNNYCRGHAVCNIDFMEKEGEIIKVSSSCSDEVKEVNLTDSMSWNLLMFDCKEKIIDDVVLYDENDKNKNDEDGSNVVVTEPDTDTDVDDEKTEKERDLDLDEDKNSDSEFISGEVENIFKFNSLEYDVYKSRFDLSLDFIGDKLKYNKSSIKLYLNFPQINETISTNVYLNLDYYKGEVSFYLWGDSKEKINLLKGDVEFVLKGVEVIYEYNSVTKIDGDGGVISVGEDSSLNKRETVGGGTGNSGRYNGNYIYIPPKITETIVFEHTGKTQLKTLAQVCPYCANPSPVLWKGDGNHETNYDIFIIFENQSEVKINQYLDATFENGAYSIFKTKPFLNKEDSFNIYYFNIPEKFVYEDTSRCRWGTKPLQNKEKFDIILNQFNWIDLRVYMAKDPRLWAHAGSAIHMSSSCNGLTNVDSFAKTFTHEFGHAFGGLRDEYTYSGNTFLYNSMNCISPENSSRWDNIFAYNGEKFKGCTSSNSYRATSSSMMKDQRRFSADAWPSAWGVVNEHYLKERIEKYE